MSADLDDLTLQVVEELLDVAKRRVMTGTVRVSTTAEILEEVAEAELDRYRVEVIPVPIGRAIEEVPLARSDRDTTIVPVVEESLVAAKQLFLEEE